MNNSKKQGGVSRAALAFALFCGLSGAAGQGLAAPQDTKATADTKADEGDKTLDTTVVVVGSRQALKTAQQTKKSADTVVDSITATDIGAFPDKSVAEALQRVPGVTVMRSVAGGDVMHFPAEPTGVIIRGLQQVKSEFNGRDIFSAGSASGLSWEDISPEMLSGVDTYKNLTADMLEGGVAGTVNLKTRLPFDQKGQLVSATLEADYGDLSKKWTPNGSALYSNRWHTELGDFGFLADIAYSQIETTSQGAILPRMMPFAAGTYTSNMNFIPSGISYNDTVYDRTRKGVSLAGQWASTDNHFKATLQYNKSTYENTWNENQLLSYWAWVDPATTNESTVWTDGSLIAPPDAPGLGINQAGGGTPFTFGADGLFQKGVITASAGGWGYGAIADWGADPVSYAAGSTDQYGTYSQYGINKPVYQPCLNSGVTHANQPCRLAPSVNLATRYSTETRTVEDTALNFVWTPTDRLKLTFDAQHVLSVNTHYDITYRNGTYANLAVDLTGDLPRLNFELPSGYNVVGTNPLSDYRNYFNESIMDHLEDSKASMNAVRIDAAYAFDNPWFSEIRAGVRMSERDQLNKWSAYNWQSISSNWGANPADSFHLDAPATANFAGYPGTYWQTTAFGTDGLLKGLIGQNTFVTIKPDYLKDINLMESTFGMTAQSANGKTPSSNWDPICMRAANISGTCFQPGEILNVKLKQDSAYVMMKFGGPEAVVFGDITLSGNIGVRLVETNLTSVGAVNFAVPFTSEELTCLPLSPEQIAALGPNQYAISPGCLARNSLADQSFSNGGFASSTVKTKHTYTLPSLNLRFSLPDGWIVRFAASRGMYMPDIGLLKNYTTLQRSYVPQSAIAVGNPSVVLNSAGQPVSYIYGYSGSTGNPRLRAIQADQFDLSVERYFAEVGSFSFDIFSKKFYDYIQNGTFVVPMTNNGVTRNVAVNGPVNGDGASVKGFEVAYQRYFTFLPKPFDGLGIQANYTHLHNEGVKNANLTLDTADGSTITRSAQEGMINPGRLEQLSDDSYNLILMYDKGPFGARLAYNWRSKYVNSVNDCCIGFPVWNAAEGFLDGSLRYALNTHTEIDLQGTNLLDTRPKIYQEVLGPTAANPNQAPLFLPAGTFAFDRRIQVSIRLKY
ncbi:TonB-dependent receptor [Asticcacaulis sp. 201]|uniref:TonB-dependent receptor n=1 Tax=Asticcacaulis sp. 201 TaxID=3028787 RepID=UPI0029161AE1|nr:TonB-dependent receptor [Asticcacaulis sp. 201]MDV6330830.1 TonB-dependent receptor [Asticcacaulis sp. 201]